MISGSARSYLLPACRLDLESRFAIVGPNGIGKVRATVVGYHPTSMEQQAHVYNSPLGSNIVLHRGLVCISSFPATWPV